MIVSSLLALSLSLAGDGQAPESDLAQTTIQQYYASSDNNRMCLQDCLTTKAYSNAALQNEAGISDPSKDDDSVLSEVMAVVWPDWWFW